MHRLILMLLMSYINIRNYKFSIKLFYIYLLRVQYEVHHSHIEQRHQLYWDVLNEANGYQIRNIKDMLLNNFVSIALPKLCQYDARNHPVIQSIKIR